MSVFASQPSFSWNEIQAPPSKAPASIAASSNPVKSLTSFNPFKSITRVFTTSVSATSTASIALSTTESTNSAARISPLSLSTQSPISPEDRDQLPLSVPPPAYSSIKSAPRPLISPPAYTPNPEPKSGPGIKPRSDTFITRSQVISSRGHGLTFDYETEEWEVLRETEERRRLDELEASQSEDTGCCAWWWSVGASPLPWAAYYVF